MQSEKLMEFGIISNSRGLKGELKVTHLCDYKEQYADVGSIIIEDKYYEIEYVKYHKEQVILKLKGIDTIELADKFKTKIIFIEREKLPVLEAGRYYIADLIGLLGLFKNGDCVGKLVNVLQTGAADIFEFTNSTEAKAKALKTVLIPKVDEFITEIDIDNKIVHLSEKARELIF